MTSILRLLDGHLPHDDAPLHRAVEWSDADSDPDSDGRLPNKMWADAVDELRKRGWSYSDGGDGTTAYPREGWNHPVHGWARNLRCACEVELRT